MDQVEITFGRSFKIWWSFAWRTWVLSFLVVIPIQIFLFFFVFRNLPPAGSKADPQTIFKMMSGMMIAWPIMMAAIIALQAQAVRWMLRKARWSDFRVALLPRDQ